MPKVEVYRIIGLAAADNQIVEYTASEDPDKVYQWDKGSNSFTRNNLPSVLVTASGYPWIDKATGSPKTFDSLITKEFKTAVTNANKYFKEVLAKLQMKEANDKKNLAQKLKRKEKKSQKAASATAAPLSGVVVVAAAAAIPPTAVTATPATTTTHFATATVDAASAPLSSTNHDIIQAILPLFHNQQQILANQSQKQENQEWKNDRILDMIGLMDSRVGEHRTEARVANEKTNEKVAKTNESLAMHVVDTSRKMNRLEEKQKQLEELFQQQQMFQQPQPVYAQQPHQMYQPHQKIVIQQPQPPVYVQQQQPIFQQSTQHTARGDGFTTVKNDKEGTDEKTGNDDAATGVPPTYGLPVAAAATTTPTPVVVVVVAATSATATKAVAVIAATSCATNVTAVDAASAISVKPSIPSTGGISSGESLYVVSKEATGTGTNVGSSKTFASLPDDVSGGGNASTPNLNNEVLGTSTTKSTTENSHDEDNKIRVNGSTYEKIQVIGRGGSCEVYQALSSYNSNSNEERSVVAIKKVTLVGVDAKTIESYKNEITILESLQGKCEYGIIKMIDSQVDLERKSIFVVMELGEDLKCALQKQPHTLNYIRLLWEQMLTAVDCIHKENIIHRDLKPANFLLVGGCLKLIDFGISEAIVNYNDTTNLYLDNRCGTLHYMSPEAINDNNFEEGEDLQIKVGYASDIWSLGCILYEMVYRKTPFAEVKGNIPISTINAITDGDHAIPFPEHIDFIKENDTKEAVINTMKQCLHRNPKKRPQIKGLLDAPWLK
jgi:serine/threonine-protein kinase TTK/MPS1